MNNLQQLEEILKKCIDIGWKPFNLQDIDNIRLNLKCIVVYFRSNDDISFTGYSHNDLFSVESGILQFVKWKDRDDEEGFYYKYGEIYLNSWYWEYNAMQMSILSIQQKIEYFISNIDI